jgi:hypothetical protein
MEIEKWHCAYGLAELAQSTGQWWPTVPQCRCVLSACTMHSHHVRA